MVTREGAYLKVVNLPAKQPLDLRFLVFCDHCDDDPERHYSREDKKGTRGQPASGTRATPEPPSSARRSGDGDGEGEGDGEGDGDKKPGRKRPARTIPDDWMPNAKHDTYAKERGLDLGQEAFRFRNHAAQVDRRCANWNAAFTNWLSKAYPAKPAPAAAGEWWR